MYIRLMTTDTVRSVDLARLVPAAPAISAIAHADISHSVSTSQNAMHIPASIQGQLLFMAANAPVRTPDTATHKATR